MKMITIIQDALVTINGTSLAPGGDDYWFDDAGQVVIHKAHKVGLRTVIQIIRVLPGSRQFQVSVIEGTDYLAYHNKD